ncbi:heme exporter protein CcmB [Pseudomonas shahriarae]|uniref:heme exporter protein CcmB n=1 Tax=Pseudomonas shahriarae TaxID=2745512 RepID=UPI002361544A|nr:heme exporter protein CcmB [Pseudomonas shahriarae]MDD1135713.1 heme exporter protein CcmB [Pseudomonas shahriarae]
MKLLWVMVWRELASYSRAPLTYLFLMAFTALSGILTFYPGDFYARNQADLMPFFNFQPWLCLVLLSPLAMRLWAQERQYGSIELLMTLPLGDFARVTGKFLAAWIVAGLALVLTFPLVLTVNYLGSPDNVAILVGYLGSWLLAGAHLAIGSCMSALAKQQMVALVLTLLVCLLFMGSGLGPVRDALLPWAPMWLVDGVASLSLLERYQAISKGLIDAGDMLFFISLIVAWLSATAVVIDLNKAQ